MSCFLKGSLVKFAVAVALFSFFSAQALAREGSFECKEVKTEIEKLKALKLQVEKLLKENNDTLKKIEEERKRLEKERRALLELEEKIKSERYRKLAEVFSKMDPELAGQKISAMTDPKKAAYILYNMKSRKAGEILNYVDPKMVNKIVKILTTIKPASSSDKPSRGS